MYRLQAFVYFSIHNFCYRSNRYIQVAQPHFCRRFNDSDLIYTRACAYDICMHFKERMTSRAKVSNGVRVRARQRKRKRSRGRMRCLISWQRITKLICNCIDCWTCIHIHAYTYVHMCAYVCLLQYAVHLKATCRANADPSGFWACQPFRPMLSLLLLSLSAIVGLDVLCLHKLKSWTSRLCSLTKWQLVCI